jgi:hypothetical protein
VNAKSRAAPGRPAPSLTSAAAKQAEVMPRIQARYDAAGGTARRCDHCAGPLPPRRRRFCCDECRRRGQKAERVIEDHDYASGVRRLVRAQGRRAGGDLAMFGMFAGSVDYARVRLAEAAAELIARGYSYGDIARELDITRQAAWKRFGRKPKVDTGPAESGAAG